MLQFKLKPQIGKNVILKLQFQMLATLCILVWASLPHSSAFSEDIKGKTNSTCIRLVGLIPQTINLGSDMRVAKYMIQTTDKLPNKTKI